MIDSFKFNAASALAAVVCLRALAGFGFPIFAPAMFDALGYGKGTTVLAAIAIAIGCPAPWLLWRYGEQLRLMSRNVPGEASVQTPAPAPKRGDEEAAVESANEPEQPNEKAGQ